MNKDGFDALYQEAMYMAEIYGIPKVVVDDTYAEFIQFVREELNNRLDGEEANKINPEIFFTLLMSEANVC